MPRAKKGKAAAAKKGAVQDKKEKAPQKSAPKKLSAFDQADELLKKQTKKGDELDDEVILDLEMLKKPLPHLPTGSILVDFAIGGCPNRHGIMPCPGLPKARITQVYGPEACGKTTLALTAASTTCASGGTVGYIDYEHEVVPDYAHALGVPIGDKSKFRLFQPESMDDGLKRMAALIKAGVDLIIIDSVGACVPKEALNQDQKTQLGLQAAMWSKWLPILKVAASRSGTTILGTAQVRSSMSIGPGGQSPKTVQGGYAWKYYPALRLDLRLISQDKGMVYNPVKNKKEEQVIGAEVQIKLAKCKVSRAQQHKYQFFLRWGAGIDDFRSCLEILSNHNVVVKGGAWYNWEMPDGTLLRGQGLEKFRKEVRETPGAWAKFQDRAIDCLSRRPSEDDIIDEDDDQEPVDDLDALMAQLNDDDGESSEVEL